MTARHAAAASVALALFATSPAQVGAAAAGTIFGVVPGKSTLSYQIKHKLHEVSADAHKLEGKLLLKPDGSAQVMVRAAISEFKSGDGNRDEHMQETMEASRYPFVVFKGVSHVPQAASYPSSVPATLEGELDFHGRKHKEQVQVTVEMKSATEMHVTGAMKVSLDQYEVQRPSLLLVPIEDACVVNLDLALEQEK